MEGRLARVVDRMLLHASSELREVLDRALDGRDIAVSDAVRLLEAKEPSEVRLIALVADYLRLQSVGDVVTFVVNRNINFTNECLVNCLFCAYSRPPNAQGAYTLTIEDVVRKVLEAKRLGATEVCIQGAINPKLDPEYYFKMLREVKRAAPDIHVHAFSPQEVYFIATKLGLSFRSTLKMLKDEGLDSMPGTAAEILDDEVRRVIAPRKIGARTWIEIIRTAHSLGIPTTATMMYGHVETNVHRAKHLDIIRGIQRDTGGFTEFVLLPFVHYNTRLYKLGMCRPGATGVEDLKVHAVARIMLNNYVKNIQASWVKLGVKYAQLMLLAGANDLGGTLMEENISRAAGATSGQHLPVEEMVRIIRGVGRTPAQRTTTYEIIKVYT